MSPACDTQAPWLADTLAGLAGRESHGYSELTDRPVRPGGEPM